jgi:hypothetical protein
MVVNEPYFNNLKFHTEFISYLQVPSAMFFGAGKTMAATTIGIVFAIVLIPLWYLRGRSVPWFAAVLFAVIVLIHPNTLGILVGEYYPVRLMIPLSLLTFILLEKESNGLRSVVLLGFLAAMCREEVGLYCALGIGAYSVLSKRWNWKYFGAGSFLAFISLGLILFTRSDPTIPHGTKSAMTQLLHITNITANITNVNRLYFLATNFVCLGFLALFDCKKGIIVFLLMIPNMITTVGGAEVTGFGTHYHSFYMGALIWASVSGLVNLIHRFRNRSAGQIIVGILLLLPILFNVTADKLLVRPGWLLSPRLLKTYKDVAGSRGAILSYIEALRKNVGPEEIVVAGVAPIPLAETGRHIFFAPVNLRKADVVIMYDSPDGPTIERAWLQTEKVSQRMLEIMRRDGFSVDNPKKIDHFLIFRKTK